MTIQDLRSRTSAIVAATEADLRRLALDAAAVIQKETGEASLVINLPGGAVATIDAGKASLAVNGSPNATIAEYLAVIEEQTKRAGIAFAAPVKAVEAKVESSVATALSVAGDIKRGIEEVIEFAEGIVHNPAQFN